MHGHATTLTVVMHGVLTQACENVVVWRLGESDDRQRRVMFVAEREISFA